MISFFRSHQKSKERTKDNRSRYCVEQVNMIQGDAKMGEQAKQQTVKIMEHRPQI